MNDLMTYAGAPINRLKKTRDRGFHIYCIKNQGQQQFHVTK